MSARGHANILEIQRMSTEDGPGIRTTVFFKGCSLDCSWCHNPESITSTREIVWHDWKCIGCTSCVEICPQGARALTDEGAVVDQSLCQDCGACIDECPSWAIERQGQSWSLEELMAELVKDRPFYEASGGGVTLSGGEPALQPGFVNALLEACRSEGIHTALDTCGMCRSDVLLDLSTRADLVLFDLKEIDGDRHRSFTGSHNRRIIENLRRVVEAIGQDEVTTELWVRTPLIPGATATEENIRGIGELLVQEVGDRLSRWDLCAFNNLCLDKYRRLGRSWSFAKTALLSANELETLAEVARSSGVASELVALSGPLRIDHDELASEVRQRG